MHQRQGRSGEPVTINREDWTDLPSPPPGLKSVRRLFFQGHIQFNINRTCDGACELIIPKVGELLTVPITACLKPLRRSFFQEFTKVNVKRTCDINYATSINLPDLPPL